MRSEILRVGNEQLLDNLEEGVIIQNEENLDIIFIKGLDDSGFEFYFPT